MNLLSETAPNWLLRYCLAFFLFKQKIKNLKCTKLEVYLKLLLKILKTNS